MIPYRLATMAVVMFGFSVTMYGQEEKSKQEDVATSESGAVRASTVFRAGTITGMKVKNAEGEDLGTIKELVLDLDDHSVRYAAVSFGGFLGVGDKLFAVPMDALTLKLDEKGNYFLLDVPKETLKNAPGFDKNSWPDMGNPRWQADVRKYYGQRDQKPQIVKGTLVSVDENTLTVLDESGEKRAFKMARNASITQDGKQSKAKDLAADRIVVLTVERREGKPLVTQIEAETPTTKTGATSQTLEGELSSVEGRTLKFKDSSGKEQSLEVAKDATVTVDGEKAKLEELKSGQEVKATVRQSEGKKTATRIEASTKKE